MPARAPRATEPKAQLLTHKGKHSQCFSQPQSQPNCSQTMKESRIFLPSTQAPVRDDLLKVFQIRPGLSEEPELASPKPVAAGL